MNKQEIFEQGIRHLVNQKAKCTNKDGACLYYDPETSHKCILGAFMPDPEIAKEFTGAVSDPKVQAYLQKVWGDQFNVKNNYLFLTQLQRYLHDFLPTAPTKAPWKIKPYQKAFLKELEKNAIKFAECWDLKIPENLFTAG